MHLSTPPGHTHGLVLPVRAGVPGGPTKGQVRGPGWRRSSQGLHVPADVEVTGPQRTLEAAVLLPGDAAVTGWAALGWLGGRWCEGLAADGTPRPVPIAVTRRSMRPQPGIVLCSERYDPRETTVVDGVRVTSAVRSVCFEMRHAASVADAVAVLDMAAADDLVTLVEVSQWLAAHPGLPGAALGRDAVSLGDENVWSPQEARTYVAWIREAGLPVPLTNRPLFDLHSRHLRTPDLVDPVAGVVAEYDGWVHERSLAQRRKDRDRHELYRDHHLECVLVMAGDLRDPTDLVRRLHAAYERARRAPTERSWTLLGPPSWVDTSTVARRRALESGERAVWLSYRDLDRR